MSAGWHAEFRTAVCEWRMASGPAFQEGPPPGAGADIVLADKHSPAPPGPPRNCWNRVFSAKAGRSLCERGKVRALQPRRLLECSPSTADFCCCFFRCGYCLYHRHERLLLARTTQPRPAHSVSAVYQMQPRGPGRGPGSVVGPAGAVCGDAASAGNVRPGNA